MKRRRKVFFLIRTTEPDVEETSNFIKSVESKG